MQEYLEMTARMGHRISRFILENGKPFAVGPKTFSGRRMKQGLCYMNATKRAIANPFMKYVEGYVTIYDIPIQHAWNVTLDGDLIDPTLRGADDRIGEYFGVEFSTRYVMEATSKNGYYGLLDGMYACHTIKDLIEGNANWKE